MSCELLNGIFPLLIQIALGVVCVFVLFYKRHIEDPKRPIKIWVLDITKQGFSALVAHFISILYSIIFTSSKGNQCAMYLLVFIIDNIIGIVIAYYLIKKINEYAYKNEKNDLISGNYGDEISYKIWCLQSIIWCGVVLLSRIICGIIIWILHIPLLELSDLIYSPFSENPHIFLVLIMIICPLLINLIIMWVQDNILKSYKPYWLIDRELYHSFQETDPIQDTY